MTPGDTARVLGACALYDNRTTGIADAAAWHAVIGDLDYDDAMEAVRRHYRDSTDRIMPAHVRRLVKEIRAERRKGEVVRALPGRYDPADDMERQVRMARGQATVAQVLEPLAAHLAEKRKALPQRSAMDELRAITPGPGWVADGDVAARELVERDGGEVA